MKRIFFARKCTKRRSNIAVAGNFVKRQTPRLSTHILDKPPTPDLTTTYPRRHVYSSRNVVEGEILVYRITRGIANDRLGDITKLNALRVRITQYI